MTDGALPTWRLFWKALPPVGFRRKLVCAFTGIGGDGAGAVRNTTEALKVLGLPPDWVYDGEALDRETRRLVLGAWRSAARVSEITDARLWLFRQGGETYAQRQGWDEPAEPHTIVIRPPSVFRKRRRGFFRR